MKYRTLGRTGLQVGEIGLGTEHVVKGEQGMVDNVVAMAIESGMNYFDFFWPQRDFRTKMGIALRGKRDNILLAGHLGVMEKNGQYSKTRDVATCEDDFHDLLRRFDTDHVDIMMLHNVDEMADLEEVLYGKFMELAARLKGEGKARFLGFSSHEPLIAQRAVQSGLVDVIMFSMNPAFDALGNMFPDNVEQESQKRMHELTKTDSQSVFAQRKDFYAVCEQEQIGLVAMKPFAGGWLLSTRKLKHPPTSTQCLEFLLSQNVVSTVVPGAKNTDELADILRYFESSAEQRDFSNILAMNDWDLGKSCMYCNHCLPCPVHINIGETIRLLDQGLQALTGEVRDAYRKLEVKAGECISCGACVKRCPFGINPMQRMYEAKALFGM
jgi:predicted aldo/keto reductase-like oxidoreductase